MARQQGGSSTKDRLRAKLEVKRRAEQQQKTIINFIFLLYLLYFISLF